jgi:hypothetical protein
MTARSTFAFFLLLRQGLLPVSLVQGAHPENPQESAIAFDQIDRVLLHVVWRPSNAHAQREHDNRSDYTSSAQA